MSYRIKTLFKTDAKLDYEHKGDGVSSQVWAAHVSGWYKFEVGVYVINGRQEISVALTYDHPEWGYHTVIGESSSNMNGAIENFISELCHVNGEDWSAAMTALGMYVEKVW